MHKKTILSCAVGAAIGVGAIGGASAATTAIVSWTLGEVDGDASIHSDFLFGTPPEGASPASPHGFGATDEAGCTAGDCAPLTFGSYASTGTTGSFGQAKFAVGEWTTGFNFGGAQGPFNPNVSRPGGTGSIAGVIDDTLSGGQQLQFSALDLGGIYHAGKTSPGFTTAGQQFYLQPDNLTNCTGAAASYIGVGCGAAAITDSTGAAFSTPFGYNVDLTSIGGGNYNFVLKYVGTIGTNTNNPDPSGGFTTSEGNWRIEGCLSTTSTACVIPSAAVPVPAAVWLFGSGLIGLVGVARRKRQS